LLLLFKKSTPLHKRLVKQSKIAAIVRCSGLNLELYVLLMAAGRGRWAILLCKKLYRLYPQMPNGRLYRHLPFGSPRAACAESLVALDVDLSSAELTHIEAMISPTAIAGTRYDRHQVKLLDSESQFIGTSFNSVKGFLLTKQVLIIVVQSGNY
jgi:hypothetical protein